MFRLRLIDESLQQCSMRDAYSVATALRGPDYPTYNPEYLQLELVIKGISAGVIRWFVLDKDAGYILIVSPKEAIIKWGELSERDKSAVRQFFDAHVHYTAHFWQALTFLARHSNEAKQYQLFCRHERLMRD